MWSTNVKKMGSKAQNLCDIYIPSCLQCFPKVSASAEQIPSGGHCSEEAAKILG